MLLGLNLENNKSGKCISGPAIRLAVTRKWIQLLLIQIVKFYKFSFSKIFYITTILYYLRTGLPWQNGCTLPPLMQRSSVPVNDSWPSVPAFVWMICTKSASSRVNRNVFGAWNSIIGLAGSRPVKLKSNWVTDGPNNYHFINLFNKKYCFSAYSRTNNAMLSFRQVSGDHAANMCA